MSDRPQEAGAGGNKIERWPRPVQGSLRWLPRYASGKGTQQIVLLSIAALLIFLRAPKLLLTGHVWAEEGSLYLRYAWNVRPLAAFLAPHQGYYSLFDNALALLAARVLPLSAAALLFTWSAFAIQLLACYFIASTDLASSLAARLLAIVAFVFAPGSQSVWLSMENAQFYFPICVAMILIEGGERAQPGKLVLICVACLSGVTSCVLLPLFLLRAWITRTRAALAYAATMLCASLVQASVVLHCMRAGYRAFTPPHYRFLGPLMLQRTIILPLLTNRGVAITNDFFAAHSNTVCLAAAWLLFSAIVLLLAGLFLAADRRLALLFAAGMLSAVVNWRGCEHCDESLFVSLPIVGARYFFNADALLSITLSVSMMLLKQRKLKAIAAALLVFVVASGFLQYWRDPFFLNDYPPWREQVTAWRRDARQPIRLAPSFWPVPLRIPAGHPNLVLPSDIYASQRAKATLNPLQK